MNAFADFELREEILEAIRELGFETPTPIQEKTIPIVLSSEQDVIALAQTGTGKTAAFGLPLIQLTDETDKSPQSLVLCPTRELCLQITKDLTHFSKHIKGIDIVAVYGGSSIDKQIRALRSGVQIVIATPGRAKDLISRKKLNLSGIKRVVLDEADEMLTMGFKEELDAILEQTPEDKQTMLFSATMSKRIISIAQKYMEDPVEIKVAKMNLGAKNVDHLYYQVHARDKYETLKRIADIHPDIYGIVFCRTRRDTKEIANKLMHDGYNADALHGDMSQAQRDEAMAKFRNRQLQILVATDVASRGLDVDDLTHIINFNLPDDIEVYTHRSGRTGRAGKSGTSIAIIHARESNRIREIEKKSGIKFDRAMVPNGYEICEKQLYALIDKIEKVEVDEKQIEPFLPAIYEKLEWLSREELIKHFVSAEFNRFLAYYKDAEDINLSPRSRKSKKGRKEAFTRLYINVGAKHQLNPKRLLGLINDNLGSKEAKVGQIEILKNFSFFEVEEGMDKPLIQALNREQFEGVSLTVEVSKEKPKPKENGGDKKSGRRGERDRRKRGGGRQKWGKRGR